MFSYRLPALDRIKLKAMPLRYDPTAYRQGVAFVGRKHRDAPLKRHQYTDQDILQTKYVGCLLCGEVYLDEAKWISHLRAHLGKGASKAKTPAKVKSAYQELVWNRGRSYLEELTDMNGPSDVPTEPIPMIESTRKAEGRVTSAATSNLAKRLLVFVPPVSEYEYIEGEEPGGVEGGAQARVSTRRDCGDRTAQSLARVSDQDHVDTSLGFHWYNPAYGPSEATDSLSGLPARFPVAEALARAGWGKKLSEIDTDFAPEGTNADSYFAPASLNMLTITWPFAVARSVSPLDIEREDTEQIAPFLRSLDEIAEQWWLRFLLELSRGEQDIMESVKHKIEERWKTPYRDYSKDVPLSKAFDMVHMSQVLRCMPKKQPAEGKEWRWKGPGPGHWRQVPIESDQFKLDDIYQDVAQEMLGRFFDDDKTGWVQWAKNSELAPATLYESPEQGNRILGAYNAVHNGTNALGKPLPWGKENEMTPTEMWNTCMLPRNLGLLNMQRMFGPKPSDDPDTALSKLSDMLDSLERTSPEHLLFFGPELQSFFSTHFDKAWESAIQEAKEKDEPIAKMPLADKAYKLIARAETLFDKARQAYDAYYPSGKGPEDQALGTGFVSAEDDESAMLLHVDAVGGAGKWFADYVGSVGEYKYPLPSNMLKRMNGHLTDIVDSLRSMPPREAVSIVRDFLTSWTDNPDANLHNHIADVVKPSDIAGFVGLLGSTLKDTTMRLDDVLETLKPVWKSAALVKSDPSLLTGLENAVLDKARQNPADAFQRGDALEWISNQPNLTTAWSVPYDLLHALLEQCQEYADEHDLDPTPFYDFYLEMVHKSKAGELDPDVERLIFEGPLRDQAFKAITKETDRTPMELFLEAAANKGPLGGATKGRIPYFPYESAVVALGEDVVVRQAKSIARLKPKGKKRVLPEELSSHLLKYLDGLGISGTLTASNLDLTRQEKTALLSSIRDAFDKWLDGDLKRAPTRFSRYEKVRGANLLDDALGGIQEQTAKGTRVLPLSLEAEVRSRVLSAYLALNATPEPPTQRAWEHKMNPPPAGSTEQVSAPVPGHMSLDSILFEAPSKIRGGMLIVHPEDLKPIEDGLLEQIRNLNSRAAPRETITTLADYMANPSVNAGIDRILQFARMMSHKGIDPGSVLALMNALAIPFGVHIAELAERERPEGS